MRLLGVAHEDRERQEVERQRAEAALRDSERRFRALVHNATDIIVVADAQGIPTYVSPSSERITGHTAASMIARDPRSLLHPDDVPSIDTALATAMLEPDGESRLELRYRHADGSWHWHEAVFRNLMDEPAVRGLVINHRDVTERHDLEEQLRHQAFHDQLTGLANRALFMDRLEHALARQQRDDSTLAVMLIDLDDFKSINDSLGHLAGDQLILAAAENLRSCLRPADTVARLGGDEFAVLLDEVPGLTELRSSAERLLDALKRTYSLGGHDLPVTASVGVAVAADTRPTAEELLRNADVAMYVAKGGGKGRVAVYEPGMHLAVHERLQIKADLAHALAAGDQLTLDYQPIVELSSGRPVGVEALVRWDHPHRGRVMPDEFIPAAEESGLILPLGRWVLAEACRQVGEWRRDDPGLSDLTVSVNISGTQLESPELLQDVHDALAGSGVDPASLVLEITETVLVSDTDVVERAVRQLKDLGVKIALDDFGTGCSSLRYLQRFPLDLIKIDRCFVTDVSSDPSQALIADTIVRLANGLGLATVGEGIEHTDDAAMLQEVHCRYGQGYLFSRPGPPSRIRGLLRSRAQSPTAVPRPRTADTSARASR
jgi:diguanylate cyclase (GGDEF)-like protein/PAS domain S-box-containing protein